MFEIKAVSPELEQKISNNNADFNIAGLMLERYYNIPEIEIEARIIRNDIDLVIFKRIQEFIKNQPSIKLVEETKSLDIYVMTSNRLNPSDKLSNLRFTLNGSDIGEYCRTDKIPKNFSLLYKSPLYWNRPITDITEIDNYDINISDSKIGNHFIDLHDIRINAKIELELNKDKNIFELKNNVSVPTFLQDALNTATTKWNFYKTQNFTSLFKTYRLKHRYRYLFSFQNEDSSTRDNFYIDITKVKSSKKDIDGRDIPVLNFIDSEIVEQNEQYEIELEIIKTEQSKLGQTIRNVLYQFISRKLLPYAFKSPIEYVYSQKEEEMIRNNYMKELNNAYNNILRYKIAIVDLLMSMSEHMSTIYRQKGQIDMNIENRISNKLKEIYGIYKYNFYEKNLQLHNYSYYVRLVSSLKKDRVNTKDRFIKKLDEYKSNYETHINNGLFSKDPKSIFISPQVITMSMEDIRAENPYSIKYNYTVTDKADGQGMLLFCFNNGESWMNKLNLIDSNLKILPVDIDVKSKKGLYVLNGEYITSLERNKYGIFDTYFIDGQPYIDAPLLLDNDSNSRIEKAIDFVDNGIEDTEGHMEIVVKRFIMGLDDEKMNIWDAGREIWMDKHEYHLDGLIYTPAYEPVGFDMNNKDSDLRLGLSWSRNLKWKPDYENTIDCLIRFEKDTKARYNGREVLVDKIENKAELVSGGQQEIRQYKIGNIFNGANDEIYTTRDDRKIYGVLKPKPFRPRVGNNIVSNKIYLPLVCDEHTGKWKILSKDNQEVEDDTIVELIYDKTNEGERYQYNWTVLRTRYDKTYLYKQGRQSQKYLFNILQACLNAAKPDESMVLKIMKYIYMPEYIQDDKNKNPVRKFLANKKYILNTYKSDEDIKVDIKFGNTMKVANSIWSSIHNPITEKNILYGEEIPDEDTYYNKNEDSVRSYSVTTVLQKFHNYIKSELLKNAIQYCKEHMGYAHILDMTCGQGGDIQKWNLYGANRCLAIDLYKTNIDNAKNRYESFKKTNPQFMTIDFMVGDASKRYKTDKVNAFPSVYDRDYYSNLMKNIYNKQVFNVIPFMFSIHYFFENKESFSNMINNINDHLAEGGILVGACFDGNRILEEYILNFMKSIEANVDEVRLDDLVIYKDGRIILKMKPNFIEKNMNASWLKKTPPRLPDDSNSIGLDIDVFIHTIEKMVKEYLVNYNYLESELRKYNIVRLSDEEMSGMSLPNKKCVGSFEDMYEYIKDIRESVDDDGLKRKIDNILDNLSEEEFNISRLNGYFMFIKKGKYVAEVIDKELDELKLKYNKYIEDVDKLDKKGNMKKYFEILSKLTDLVKETKSSGSVSMKRYNEEVVKPKLRLLLDDYKKLAKK
jgi:hypothetical protein